jgi:multidrug efflux pump subunit AcrA (membrane-fusion protein)
MALDFDAAGTPIDADRFPLNTARLLQAQASYRPVWLWLGGIGIALVVILFLPWQQNVQGSGKVSALWPQDRPQTLPSRIDGRIDRWLVPEGTFVKAGTPIVDISEIKDEYMDPQLIARTKEQLDAKEQGNQDKSAKARAYAAQIDALERTLGFKREQLRNKVELYTAALEQAVLDDSLARDQYRRREALFASPLGLTSLNDLQASRLKAQSTTAKLVEKRNELANARVDLEGVDAEYAEKIQKARAEQSATLADVQEGASEISKLRNKLASLEVRRGYYKITAPQDGYVVKAMKQGVGELVKAGDPIVTVQPTLRRRAVELYVRAMDVPLLRPGGKIRLVFDGWPSLQFSGWPSVSVGTFGGVITVIDQVAGTDGKFRVLVTPDAADEPWPKQLRLGSGVYGWAALNEVRVWFELWRQLNGFPPSLNGVEGQGASAGDAKGAGKADAAGGKK